MLIDFFLQVFREYPDNIALVSNGQEFSYGWLEERVQLWQKQLSSDSIQAGSVVAIEADFSPDSVALFLALIEQRAILVPLTKSVENKKAEFYRVSGVECSYKLEEASEPHPCVRIGERFEHPLYRHLRELNSPGLVLFSSGSTGASKAAVHDIVPLLEKFKVRRKSSKTIPFLLYDHIGGVNTMLYTLSNGGMLITVQQRTPDAVLSLVEKYGVELLPTSPSFINLILVSEAHTRYDLASLKTVTYGTEPMPESTLRRFHAALPQVDLLQTYGLSEVGILRSKSKSSDSLWVRIGGEGFETRVVDGILHIKAKSAMLGYLNAPSPFTEDGWFVTGDAVEVDGEYFKILGRRSEMINVGGQKVYPAEVESVIQEMPEVAEVTVYGESNPLMGQIVCARVTPAQKEYFDELPLLVKKTCKSRLESFKVPVRVVIDDQQQHGDRFKKLRSEVSKRSSSAT